MQIKTSDASGNALDWLVAKCVEQDAQAQAALGRFYSPGCRFEPSTAWAHGGPIIEREIDALFRGRTLAGDVVWTATAQGNGDVVEYGPTPLIAAMRCYVASKLGEVVDVPDALTLESKQQS